MRIRGRRIGTTLYPSTAAINKSVSEFRGNTIEVTEVCERGERGGGAPRRSEIFARARAGEIRNPSSRPAGHDTKHERFPELQVLLFVCKCN